MLDKKLYAARITLSIENVLFETNLRASEAKKQAFLRFCGLGLGAWAVLKAVQAPIFVDQIAHCIRRMDLRCVDVVMLINLNETELVRNDSTITDRHGHSIRILFSQTESHASPLPDSSHLLVSNFAWDGMLSLFIFIFV